MAYDKITFQKKLNDSVQVGDTLYYSNVTGAIPTDPSPVGTINWVGEKEIRIDPNTAPAAEETTLTGYIDVMDNFNGTFDIDISSWTLGTSTGVWETTTGTCDGGSYTNDQAGCISHGDCGANIDVTFSFCSTASVCSSYPSTYLTSGTCTDHGDCNQPVPSGLTNMLVDDCTDYGDCVVPYFFGTVSSITESTCDDSGACYDPSGTAVGAEIDGSVVGALMVYTNKNDCENQVSCIDGQGVDQSATYSTSGACAGVGTCNYNHSVWSPQTGVLYNVTNANCLNAAWVSATTGHTNVSSQGWTVNSWDAYTWTASTWNVYTWTNYTWDPLGLVWIGYNWINDGSVYHATENSGLDGSARMYLDSMQGLGTSGYVGQTITLEPNTDYTISFGAEIIVGELDFQISGALVDSGTTSGTYTNQSGTNGQISYSNTFTAGSSDLTIKFYGTDGDPTFAYIDNVSIMDDQYLTTNLNNYFMFEKPEHNNYTNVSSLKGYFAKVEFSNDSEEKQELFAVGSEITISSK